MRRPRRLIRIGTVTVYPQSKAGTMDNVNVLILGLLHPADMGFLADYRRHLRHPSVPSFFPPFLYTLDK
jgi:hypothetical protein